MKNKITKSKFFSFFTALYVTLLQTLLLSVFLYLFSVLNVYFLCFWVVFSFIFSFVLIHYRLDKYIYNSIKNTYEELALIESTTFNSKLVNTDMASLKIEIDNYAKNKKLELEALKVREEYRKEFIGNVSHELKTPLFTVQGYISTLLEGAAEDPNIRDKYLKRAEKGVDRLIYIVKDLDMITKLEIGDLNLNREAFDIIQLISNVYELLEIKANNKNISLVLDKNYFGDCGSRTYSASFNKFSCKFY